MNTSTKTQTELVITRIFDAPRTLIWKAWTNPEYIMRWWGPKHFTSPACKVDLRVGGKYLFCMKSKEGREFWSTGTYKEIIPLEKMVFTDSFADSKGNIVPATYYGMEKDFPMEMEVKITFEDIDGRTKMTMHHAGFPAGQMSEMAEIGWKQSFDKLADSLTHEKTITGLDRKYKTPDQIKDINLLAEAEIIITAPVQNVWDALVNPEMIKQYMFGTETISNWKAGSPIIWRGEWQGRHYEDKGTILEIEKDRTLRFTHFSPLSGLTDIPENYHTVTIELSTVGTRTKVSLMQDNNSNEREREDSEKNWNMALGVMKNLVEERPFKK